MRADHSPAEWRKKLGRRAARLVREIKEKNPHTVIEEEIVDIFFAGCRLFGDAVMTQKLETVRQTHQRRLAERCLGCPASVKGTGLDYCRACMRKMNRALRELGM
jgi:hypothetical protein